MVVAPEDVPAGSRVMLATPDALVSAVPVDGVIVANVGSVANVTTIFGTPTPPDVTVAETVVGAADVIEVTGVPALLVRDNDKLEAAAVVVVLVVVDPEADEAAPLPPQLDNNVAVATNNKAVNVLA